MQNLFIILIVIFLTSCSADENKKTAKIVPPVRVEKARIEKISREIQAVGNVRPSASVNILPRVAGEIIDVNFREGENVTVGQKLLQIDPRPYEAALKEKKANLSKSEAQLIKAMDDKRRYQRLVGNGYVSREAYDQTTTDAAALKATVMADRAAVESAALDLAYCQLKAPIDGRIGALTVHKGNMIKSSATEPIAQIDTISPCYVSFSVPEIYLSQILEQLKRGNVTVSATPPGAAGELGELMLVDNSVDDKTGTIKLRGIFKNENQHLWPGQFVNIKLFLGDSQDTLVIPTKAILPGKDGSFIYVANENSEAEYRKVEPLFNVDKKTALQNEVKPGENVIIEGHIRLTPGAKVQIID